MSMPELVLLAKIFVKFAGSLLIFLVFITVVANLIFGDAYDRVMHRPKGRTQCSNPQNPISKD